MSDTQVIEDVMGGFVFRNLYQRAKERRAADPVASAMAELSNWTDDEKVRVLEHVAEQLWRDAGPENDYHPRMYEGIMLALRRLGRTDIDVLWEQVRYSLRFGRPLRPPEGSRLRLVTHNGERVEP